MSLFWVVLVGGLAAFAGSGLALGAALGLTGLLILQFLAGGVTFVAVDAVWNCSEFLHFKRNPLIYFVG